MDASLKVWLSGLYLRWSLFEGRGQLEAVVKVPTNFSGSFNIGAYEPGTDTTQSNSVKTTVPPP